MARPMGVTKKSNGYVEVLGSDYEDTPKAVYAAIAVSALTVGGDYLDEARERVAAEWWALFDNKIVSQKPPMPRPAERV